MSACTRVPDSCQQNSLCARHNKRNSASFFVCAAAAAAAPHNNIIVFVLLHALVAHMPAKTTTARMRRPQYYRNLIKFQFT